MSTVVLIVDDDPGLQDILETILEMAGYKPIIAGDGVEALAILRDVTPALILLDLMMPRMDGFTFIEELEQRGLRASAPIIVLTADSRAARKAARLKVEGYVEKPFELQTLLDEMHRLLPT